MLIKVLVCFFIILMLERLTGKLHLSVLAGVVFLGLSSGLSFYETFMSIVRTWVSVRTIFVLGVVVVIVTFSSMMRYSGRMSRIVSTFSEMVRSRKTSAASMPALVGLLPMPGGAVFSAPMVGELIRDDLPPGHKGIINYWFRHFWEYILPLYPGVILGMEYARWEIDHWFAVMLPLSAIMVSGGVLFLLRGVQLPNLTAARAAMRVRIGRFFLNAYPVLGSVIMVFIILGVMKVIRFDAIMTARFGADTGRKMMQYFPVIAGLGIGMLELMRVDRIPLLKMMDRSFLKGMGNMILSVGFVLSLSGMIRDTNAAMAVRNELRALHVPTVLVIGILPMLSGLITGLAVGFVGTSFPLVLALVDKPQLMAPALILAYGFGHVGMMLSPVHICFIMTRDHFNSTMGSMYAYMAKPVLFMLAGICFYALTWYMFFT